MHLSFFFLLITLNDFFIFLSCYLHFPSHNYPRNTYKRILILHNNPELKKKGSTPQNPEQNLKLGVSIQSTGFLNNIIEYGNNRMARRAVGVLQKMPAYQIFPEEIHYTAAVWACEKSDQFKLALSVYEEMKSMNMKPSSSTFEALISVSEKTNHCDDAIKFFNEMMESNIVPNTKIFNSYLIAVDKAGKSELVFSVIDSMKKLNIPRDLVTYTACIWSCEKTGEGIMARKLLRTMEEDGLPANTESYNAALWACVKGGYWQEAMELFNHMDAIGLKKDKVSYNAAIWACEIAGNYNKAVEYLRLMKADGNVRETMSFDGAISALQKANKWEQIIEIFTWMRRDKVEKSYVTYKLIIEVLDQVHKPELLHEIYLEALRLGYYDPWIKNTRILDVRKYPFAIAKIALRVVLEAMQKKKLDLFNLNILVANTTDTGSFGYENPEFVENLQNYLSNLNLNFEAVYDEADSISSFISVDKTSLIYGDSSDDDIDTDTPFIDEDVAYRSGLKPSGIKQYGKRMKSNNYQPALLNVTKVIENDAVKLFIPRDSLEIWLQSQNE